MPEMHQGMAAEQSKTGAEIEMNEDITFCSSECDNLQCGRNPKHIKLHDIPHSFSDIEDTEMCLKSAHRDERLVIRITEDENCRIVPIEEKMPHKVSEVVCARCGTRWIAARPQGTLLKQLECKYCGAGFVIETGEEVNPSE